MWFSGTFAGSITIDWQPPAKESIRIATVFALFILALALTENHGMAEAWSSSSSPFTIQALNYLEWRDAVASCTLCAQIIRLYMVTIFGQSSCRDGIERIPIIVSCWCKSGRQGFRISLTCINLSTPNSNYARMAEWRNNAQKNDCWSGALTRCVSLLVYCFRPDLRVDFTREFHYPIVKIQITGIVAQKMNACSTLRTLIHLRIKAIYGLHIASRCRWPCWSRFWSLV
jgi:hypothetical protein